MVDYYAIFDDVLRNFNDNNKWKNARFGKIKIISNTKVGDVGQEYIVQLCEKLHIPYNLPHTKDGKVARQSPWDIEILGIEYEIKTATEDTSGHFQFNHIRYHRSYDAVLCLGVSPDALFFNLYSKADLVTGKVANLVSMEKSGNASYKLTRRKEQLYPIDAFEKLIKNFSV